MKVRFLLIVPCLTYAWNVFSDTTQLYCAKNNAYISIGMSEAEVINACGEPASQRDSNQPITKKVPMQQLVYSNAGAPKAFYGVWSLPMGNTYTRTPMPFSSAQGNVSLQINIVNNKVYGIQMNGQDTNGMSLCGGRSIEVGSPVSSVYNACGQPSLVNKSFINVPIQSTSKPKIWTYQPNPYASSFSLTFVDGKLQSIQQ